MNIGAIIANNKIILVITNCTPPTVYKYCPIAWICKKLVIAVSNETGLNEVNTSPTVGELNNNRFKLFKYIVFKLLNCKKDFVGFNFKLSIIMVKIGFVLRNKF